MSFNPRSENKNRRCPSSVHQQAIPNHSAPWQEILNIDRPSILSLPSLPQLQPLNSTGGRRSNISSGISLLSNFYPQNANLEPQSGPKITSNADRIGFQIEVVRTVGQGYGYGYGMDQMGLIGARIDAGVTYSLVMEDHGGRISCAVWVGGYTGYRKTLIVFR